MFSVITHTLKLLTWDLARDFLLWPLWWYGEGLKTTWQILFNWIFSWHQRLGIGIWIKNWFKPMYAQYDWQGRLISFFFRTITIVWKVVLFMFGFLVFLMIFFLYILLPVLAFIFLILSFV